MQEPPTTTTTTPSSSSIESDILTHLISSTSVLEDLHSTLLVTLQRIGWTERVKCLSLELIRAGRCEKFDDVVEAIVAGAEGREHPCLPSNSNLTVGNGNHDNSNGNDLSEVGNIDVRVPPSVVEQGVTVIREALGDVFVIEADDESSSSSSSSSTRENGNAPSGNAKKSAKPVKSGKNK